MLFGFLSLKTYILIGVVVGAIIYLIALVAGPSAIQFFTQIESNALISGVSPAITTLIVGPFLFAFSQPIAGALIAAFLWPLIIVWFVLLFLLLILSAFSGGYNSAATGTDQFNG